MPERPHRLGGGRPPAAAAVAAWGGGNFGAQRAAIVYSLIGSRGAAGVEPVAYLRDVLPRLAERAWQERARDAAPRVEAAPGRRGAGGGAGRCGGLPAAED